MLHRKYFIISCVFNLSQTVLSLCKPSMAYATITHWAQLSDSSTFPKTARAHALLRTSNAINEGNAKSPSRRASEATV